ncbi:MAG: ABC transporter ATP-binding protein, partial [Lachnospiraceae bacterium]|nr:ABC transporter ATP-binding protein [Lachnospiraceae bacterium]
MWKLLRYLKNYKKESIIGPLFKLTEAIFELIVPLVMSDIIDVGIVNGDKNYILGKGALLLLFGLVGLGCSLTAQFFAAKAAMGFGAELRHDMFDYYMGMTYSEHDSIGAATLINRLNVDVNQVQSGVNLALRLFLRSPFIVVGAVIMSFTIDVRLALITLVATPVIAVVVYIIMMKTITRFKQIQAKLDDILAASRGNLAGVRVVRAFARQEKEKETFNKTTDELYDLSIHTGHISALLNPISYVLLNIAVILVLWYGAKGVDTGRLTRGEVIALVNYLSQILLALIAMVNLINSFTKAIASAGRITDVFDPEEFEKKKTLAGAEKLTVLPEAGGRPHIRFENVSFTYPGAEAPSVSNIDFSVEKGRVLGIIGG